MTKKVSKTTKKKITKKIKRLSKKDLNIFKEYLFNARDDVMAQIQDISQETLMKTQREATGDISGHSMHLADVASDNYERDFKIGLVSNERKVISEIDDALKRIEEGPYGICQMCQKPISKVRLKAIPYTKHSKKCQEKLEKENKI